MIRISLFFSFIFLSLFATSQTVDFSYTSSDGISCNPDTLQFTQNVTGSPIGFIWDFGNGEKSFISDPAIVFTQAGNYNVKLIAIYPEGAKEISKTVVISPTIRPGITVDKSYICQPGTINFTVTSNGNISNYEWDFGDSTGIVSLSANTTSHNYTDFATRTVLVKATDAGGCIGTDSIRVEIKKIPATSTVSNTSGCIPQTPNFTSSYTLPPGDFITSYLWDFDDGTAPVTLPGSSASHVYNTVGAHIPKVTVVTNEGCTSTYSFQRLGYGTPPTGIVAGTLNSVICGSESPIFHANATDATFYLWNLGEGPTFIGDSVEQYQYKTLGVKVVNVIPYFNNCSGQSAQIPIQVIGVIAGYTAQNTCQDKETFSFTNSSIGAVSSYVWNFGDGSATVNTVNTSHTFPSSGAFISSLTVSDITTGCADTLNTNIYTAQPKLINTDSSICKYTSTTFTIGDNYTNDSTTFTWNVAGKIIQSDSLPASITLNADVLGNYPVNNVIIQQRNTGNTCPDTLSLDHAILVKGPNLSFNIPASVCFGDTVNIVNTSAPFLPADSVVLWQWNYGNSSSNDTIYQPAPILYTAARNYTVKLTAIDINGCRDTLQQRVTVNPIPFLQVLPQGDTLCLGQTDSLFAFHSDSITWSPAAGLSCITCDTVLARPNATTQYIVTATNRGNCSIKDTVLIQVVQPFTLALSANQYICRDERITLSVAPENKVIVWSPAIGLSNPSIATPTASPGETTIYTVSVTDSLGCATQTATTTVFLKTTPTVDAGPNQVIVFGTNFSIAPTYSNNAGSYLWAPTDGLNCITCRNTTGTAVTSHTYTITVTSDSGCVAKDSVVIAIECKDANLQMPSAFTPNNDGLNDYFYPITRGIKTIVKFVIYNREGQVLFEGKNFAPNTRELGWTGDFKGNRQPPRAYVYVLEALCDAGEKLVKGGTVMLLR